MTKTRRITPHEWIQDYFSPVVSVMASAEAESLARTNNLSVAELLQPFGKLSTDVTLKDPEGANHSVTGLAVQFTDWHKDPARLIGSKLVSDTVNHVHHEPVVTREFGDGLVLEAPGFTPWFDSWMKLTMAAVPSGLEHEFIRTSLGCVFVVSADQSDPVEAFKALSQTQYRHQHEGGGKHPNSAGVGGTSNAAHNAYPQYITPNVLKYYVVLHDAHAHTEATAQENFTKVQSAFGQANCSLLQVNSSSAEQKPDQAVADHWIRHSTATHRFSTVETRLAAIVGTTTTLIPKTPVTTANNHSAAASPPVSVDHPLALEDDHSPVPDPKSAVPELAKLVPATSANTAVHINVNDVERIRQFVRDFAIKGLIPHVEKQLRTLHEIVTNRKGRSLFNVGVKRWFGQSKPGTASGTSVIYGKDATELQIRKLGDLYFLFKLYKSAYNCYHTAKKDFQSDEAWNYYAGAAEMSALSQFMQNDPSKKYPAHYMEDSITKYLSVCQMPEFAVRATLFDALCLKYHGMFQEAALSYIRMTNEVKDLRSGLLLEQAAYCYLLCNQPYVRKYAFYVILAGYRFSKSGQKHHSSRVYGQGYQIYKGLNWSLSEDHILYSLGHQSLLLKEYRNAAGLFNDLLSMEVPNPNPTQQMCHLREFFIVHHLREKEEKQIAEIPIPSFDPQNCKVDLSCESYQEDPNQASVSWQDLEKLVLEKVTGNEVMFMSKTSQTVFGPQTANSLKPQATVGEPVKLHLPVSNPFLTPLLLRKIHLIWKFISEDGQTVVTNFGDKKTPGHEKYVKSPLLESVLLENSKATVLEMTFVPQQVGSVEVVGVEFSLKAQFPQSESTDHTIHGRQYLSVRGPRLSSTKEHKTKVVHGPDQRLSFAVLEARPRLVVEFKSAPETLLAGEIRKIEVVMTNTGGGYISNIHLVHRQPGRLSFMGTNKGKSGCHLPFEFPVVTDPCLNQTREDGSSVEHSLDILPSVVCPDIPAGKSVRVPLWICGCQLSLAKTFFETYFYYEYNCESGQSVASGKRPNYRITRSGLHCQVLPSIHLTATKLSSCVYNNNPDNAIVVNVSNGSGGGGGAGKASSSADAARVKGRQLADIHVSQIALLSSRHLKLDSVLSTDQPIVNRQESATFCLRSTRSREKTAEAQDVITVSDVRWKGGGGPNTSQDLFMDFLKAGFTYEGKAKKPVLRSDLIVVSWLGKLASGGAGDTAVQGQSFVPLQDGKATNFPADRVDGRSSANTRESDQSDAESGVPASNCAASLKVSVVNEPKLVHDFRTQPVAPVTFQVVVDNPSQEPAFFLYRVEGGGKVVFVGCTQAKLSVGGGQTKTLTFQVNVTSPGIYSFPGAFKFQAFKENADTQNYDNQQEELIPMHISFVVEDTP